MDPRLSASTASSSVPIVLSHPDDAPQHTKPSLTKVLELPDKQRRRAQSIAAHLDEELDNGAVRTAILSIEHFLKKSPIRTPPGDHTGWGVLQVEKHRNRDTMPPQSTHANKPARPPPRLAVSAPVVTKSALGRPVPASPVGNAWSGEHYWKPQFSQSVPGSPVSAQEAGCPHSDLLRRAVYESVAVELAKCARDVKAEAALRDESITHVEAEVVAAMQVLEDKNTSYAAHYDMPVPRDITTRLRAFGEQEKHALVLNSIYHYADLRDVPRWLQTEQTSLQHTTVLDYAHANLKIVRERRKSAGLEPSEPAFALVYAVQILEEKIRRLKASENEGSDDDEVEYGKFLKSIQEELNAAEENRRPNPRRDVSDGGLEARRLKGKAPSAFDLEAWASELKELDDSNEKIGVAITKDD